MMRISSHTGFAHLNKQELSDSLSALVESSNIKPTLYAAQRKPDRSPWRKRASLLDDAFSEEIRKIEAQKNMPIQG